MADAWTQIGNALGGDSELAYQQGLALGAKTQDALAAARTRVMENQAKMALSEQLQNANIPFDIAEATGTAFQGGGNIGDVIALAAKNQEMGFRDDAAGVTGLDFATGNRRAMGFASGPVDRFQKVGAGADDRFDAAGIQPLGDAIAGVDGGGTSAALQLIHEIEARERVRRGDPNFQLSPRQAMGIARESQRLTDQGGVPGVVDFLDALGLTDGRAPPVAPVAAPAAPSATPAAIAPAATSEAAVAATAPAGVAIAPLSTAAEVGQNVAEIERSKVVGKGVGEAQLQLPQAEARFNNQTAQTDLVIGNIDKAVEEAGVWTAGPGGVATGWLPGTPAYDYKSRVDMIKANVGFQQLQQMRYESPTGGALGQVAVQELQFLQSALGNLDTAQSPSQLSEMLGQVSQRYKQFKAAAAADFDAAKKKASMLTPGTAPTGAAPAAPGATMSLEQYLSSKGY